ncbi:MAG: phosphotransferase [Halioglobus sp.]|nr:phosphotransferase [Halioglobus sp.]
MANLPTPLAENAAHLDRLCELFDLCQPRGELRRVAGGFHHVMWRLATRSGCFAIKQFADDVNFGDPATVARLNATEVAAAEFARLGIPALASLAHADRHLQVFDGVGYLVFPWTDSRARSRNAIAQYHSATVAGILARMHRAQIQVTGLAEPTTWPLTAQRLNDLLALAQQHNVREVIYMLDRMDDILAVVQRQQSALSVLARRETVSHGDLDHKNVLWSASGQPLLIDWESARPINPTYELLLEALDWSGITAHFDHGPFQHFLSAYVQAGGDIAAEYISAAFDAILGAWINWMLFNVGRAAGVEDLRQRAIGTEQIDVAVSALLRLEKHIPRLKDIAQRCAERRCAEPGNV